jgi:soluble lytic murein transglycosylase-like protein
MMHRRIAYLVGALLMAALPATTQAASDASETARGALQSEDALGRALGQVKSAAGCAARSLRLAVGRSMGELRGSAARAARLELTPFGGADGRASTAEQLAFRLTQDGRFDDLIAVESERWGLDPFLFKGLLLNESGLNPTSVGRKRYGVVRGKKRVVSGGSVGIAQFSASGIRGVTALRRSRATWGETVDAFSAAKALDPREAIAAAAEVLSSHIVRYGRDGGVTAYNTGVKGGELVRRYGFWRARGMGKLRRAGHIHLQGDHFLLNVLRRTNRLRTEAGLPPLPPPERDRASNPPPSRPPHIREPVPNS